MTNRYLVDTSVWIEALRPRGRQSLRDWVRKQMLQKTIVLAPPVRMEFLIGTKNERQFARLKDHLDALTMLANDNAVWERAAVVGGLTRRQGITVPFMDILIAAWALEEDCVLVHQDRHYEMLALATGVRTISYIE